MARLVAFFILLVAPAARAQSDADRALIERTLDALRIEAQMSSVATAFAGLPVAADSFAADVRARFRERVLSDWQPALLRDALPFLESDVYARAIERAVASQTPEAQAALLAALADPPPGSLADSALAVRFVEATGALETVRGTQRRGVFAIVTQVPSYLEVRARENLTPEAAVEILLGPDDVFRDDFVLGVRYQLQRTPQDQVQAEIAYGESAAGRYVSAALREAVIEATVPLMVRWALHIEASDAASSSPPADETGVQHEGDADPELVGGLEGLAAQIVYPEVARRAGIEGTVFVQFVVNERGAVVAPVVLRSPDASLSEEALRVVRAARFQPGRQRGEPAAVRFVLPVRFALRDSPQPEPMPGATTGDD